MLAASRVESEGDFNPGVGDLLLEAETDARLVMKGFLSHGLGIDQRHLHNSPLKRSGYVRLLMQSSLTRYASSWSANCGRTVISSSYRSAMRNLHEIEPVALLTLRNIRSSELSATQSAVAMHFPIPPFAANRVHLASSAASIPISSY